MKYNLSKTNFFLMIGSVAIIVLGLFLMTGEPSYATEFNPDIFSKRRIDVGPMIVLFGFVSMIFSILYTSQKE